MWLKGGACATFCYFLLFLGRRPHQIILNTVFDVSHKMNVGTAWVDPPVHPVVPRYTVMRGLLYFKSRLFMCMQVSLVYRVTIVFFQIFYFFVRARDVREIHLS